MDDSTSHQFHQAKALSRGGQSSAAAALYRTIADELSPDMDCVAFYLLAAEALTQAGQLTEAIRMCRKATSVDPNSAFAWRSLGSTLLLQGSDIESEDALNMSISIKPTATAYLYLSVLYLAHDQLAEAEKYCQHAIRLSPDFDEALYNLGRIMRRRCCWDKALEALESALKISPSYGSAHREIASIYFELQSLTQAECHARSALQLDPYDKDANTLLNRIRDRIEGRV